MIDSAHSSVPLVSVLHTTCWNLLVMLSIGLDLTLCLHYTRRWVLLVWVVATLFNTASILWLTCIQVDWICWCVKLRLCIHFIGIAFYVLLLRIICTETTQLNLLINNILILWTSKGVQNSLAVAREALFLTYLLLFLMRAFWEWW